MTDQPLPRIKTANITPATQAIFNQHWEARTEENIKDCLHPMFFNPVNNRLRPGDRITLCQFKDGSWDMMLAFVALRVVSIDDGHVYLISEGDIIPCDLAPHMANLSEPVPVTIKKTYGAHQIAGLDHWGIFPEFPTKQDCMDWIERNGKTVYLDKGKSAD